MTPRAPGEHAAPLSPRAALAASLLGAAAGWAALILLWLVLAAWMEVLAR